MRYIIVFVDTNELRVLYFKAAHSHSGDNIYIYNGCGKVYFFQNVLTDNMEEWFEENGCPAAAAAAAAARVASSLVLSACDGLAASAFERG